MTLPDWAEEEYEWLLLHQRAFTYPVSVVTECYCSIYANICQRLNRVGELHTCIPVHSGLSQCCNSLGLSISDGIATFCLLVVAPNKRVAPNKQT